ncbi:sister chromatid cohesion protein-like protein Mis4 [Cucurbitaria berberidis CBS 394.84]|uniref:Sister chromatid cohesion protein n=1 Tax=Cucurbitaria berberidis CBS 394.84 TaxID=1168544 RepID=A0A9P4GKB6_9PLEO|nr:sister chromatid cohesion protein-like protein Mis4 [Cucurbitaria berberidis CBS 394.84]KAF1846701.1 sister chromatid cohesion protein-like protein Mis4 [Cucurbitaria berberidis CBS 394.84]
MATFENANWHNANGSGLPYRRPPTVNEALAHSPFTSIIPFSPDIIPFPSAEPPTPPSTLTPDQQRAADKAVGILNDEIKGQSTAHHLNDTLNQLRALLQRDKLPEYNFKPMPQLQTPPPDSPTTATNSSYELSLSPFATILLKRTDVSFAPFGVRTPARQATPSHQARGAAQLPPATPNGNAYAQNANLPYPSSALSYAPSSTPDRPPGPAVMIKPKSVRRQDYKRYDSINTPESLSQKTKDSHQNESGATVLRPHEREIADRKVEELQSLVTSLSEDQDDVDDSSNFTRVTTAEGDANVLNPRPMGVLSEKMSNVVNLGRFDALSVELVMQIQSLLYPTVTTTTKNGLFPQDEGTPELSESIETAKLALKASKLLLDTMIKGRDDYRMRREEMIDIIIDFVKLIKDACIVPIVRSRRSGASEDLFSAASGQKMELQTVLSLCGNILSCFAALIGKCNLSDRALHTLEYLTLEVLVEQNSDHEKDAVFTIAKFEQFRQKAMDVIAQIFAQHIGQQQSILNGIFSNLEKLPDKKASARQFKSAREAPIMTISALFMRFVQVVATNRESEPAITTNTSLEEELSDYEPGISASKRARKRSGSDTPIQIAQNLTHSANQIAGRITMFLFDRASNVSKTGDKPFRNLLDLFIDDFCQVLGSPEWPAAVVLLQGLLVRTRNIFKREQAAKQSVVDKDMALTTMARIGCGVIDFKHRLTKLKRGLDISQSDLSSRLDRLVDDAIGNGPQERINDLDLLAFDGPYRIIIESLSGYLNLRSNPEDPHLQSVSGFYVSSWLAAVSQAFPAEDEDGRPQTAKDVQQHLESIILDPKWLARKYKFQTISDAQCKLAAGIVTLHSKVCKFLPTMVNIMLSCAEDKHSPKLRSRGITGLEQLIVKDPGVISEGHVKTIARSLSATSPMVRESTLSLISTCLQREPSLQRHFLTNILRLTIDPSNGPKKRAIKLLKDIYSGPTSTDIKLQIATSLLLASQDDETSISDLSRNVLEEILLTSVSCNAKTDESRLKLDRAQRVTLMVDIIESIQSSTAHLEAFEKFFIHALSPDAKGPIANLRTCKELVALMIDGVIDPGSGSDVNSQGRILDALSIFAKVESALFTIDQVQLLKLYIKEIANSEDVSLVRPTVVIYRHVLPTLPSLQYAFTEEVRKGLMKNVSKLAIGASQAVPRSRETLLEVAHCLRTINAMPGMGPGDLCNCTALALCQLRPLLVESVEERTALHHRITSYLLVLGTFGKVFDFDEYIEVFRSKIASIASGLISKRGVTEKQLEPLLNGKALASRLFLDTVLPFTTQTWNLSIREHALGSLGGICQQSPLFFRRPEVEKVIKAVFDGESNDRLKLVALTFFNDYFIFAERRSDTGAQIATGKGAVNESARLDTSFVANDEDSATVILATLFLQSFKDVALNYNNELALLATKLIVSISRQGLVHPKECGPTLVALGTSLNEHIAEVASLEHKRVHEKQESYLEKEYMQAIQLAFDYQRNVFNDSHGMLETGQSPKLAKLFEALKLGKKVTFKKFVANACKQVDFDLSKLDTSGAIPKVVLFARFCLENLALLDFTHLEELAVFLNAMEAIVLKHTGPIVALAIETEMPKQSIFPQHAPAQDLPQQLQGHEGLSGVLPAPFESILSISQAAIDDARLRQITTACMILQMAWETRTFVRRCYNLHKSNGRIHQKEYAKPANRNNFVSGKELRERLTPIMSALNNREAMVRQCYDFADLLEIDRETRIGESEDESSLGAGYETPNEDGDGANGAPFPTSARGKKRKSNVSLGNTPKKSRGRPVGAKGKGKRHSRTPDDDDDSD